MTDNHSIWILDRFGPRGAKLAIVVSGLLYFVLIVGGAALILVDGWQGGGAIRWLVIGGVALMALLLWIRIVLASWRAIKARSGEIEVPPLANNNEDTGIWGVGGPAMREPGSTGIARTLRGPRADEEE